MNRASLQALTWGTIVAAVVSALWLAASGGDEIDAVPGAAAAVLADWS